MKLQTQDGRPVYILNENSERERGKTAQENNIAAAKAVAQAIKTTLGPKGMDKMIVDSSGDIMVTNDGASILRDLGIKHPAAKMIVSVAKTQDENCGDGTTSAVILTGELLAQAEELIDNGIHPSIIAEGYKKASVKAKEIAKDCSIPVSEEGLKDILFNIAMTSMSGKGAEISREVLSDIVVKAVLNAHEHGKINLDDIYIKSQHGASVHETEVFNGFIIDKNKRSKEMPCKINNPKILLLDGEIDIKQAQMDTSLNIDDPDVLDKMISNDEDKLKSMARKVINSGVDVVLVRKGIENIPARMFAKNGIIAVDMYKLKNLERISRISGAEIISDVDDITKGVLGTVDVIEEKDIGETSVMYLKGNNSPITSIMIRGSSLQLVEELERALHDALSVAKVTLDDFSIVSGGGSTCMEIAIGLREYAKTVGGREQLAITRFANAMESIPKTLAENAGISRLDMIIKLNNEHNNGNKHAGINALTGEVDNMLENNIIQPLKLILSEIDSATEASSMILRIDDVVIKNPEDFSNE